MPLQADRVQHAGRGLDDARRRMPFTLGEEKPLHRDAAERREIDDVGVLDAVAEAAARRDERIGERAAIRSETRDPSVCRAWPTASQTTRCASKTGPSMQVACDAACRRPRVARTTQL
jgi:hypothetical protein